MRKFLAILLVIILIAAAVGGFFLWRSNQALAEENAQQAADLISVRRQLAMAKATPTPTAAPTTPKPAATPVPPVVLKEFNVQFAPGAVVADVTTTYSAGDKSFALTTKTLAAKGGSCAAPGALGVVTRQAKTAAAPAGATKVATVKTYDFYYKGAAACAEAPQLQNEQQAALQSALATLGPM